MSQSSGFDLSKLSTASKILLAGGILYLIDTFLPWQRVDLGAFGSASASGMEGVGVLNMLLAIALIVWEGMAIAGVDIKAPRALVSAGLAGAIVLFTLIKILVDNEAIFIFAWVGAVLALTIGYGGWMRWQEHQAGGGGGGAMPGPPPAPPAGGGFTS